MEEMSSTTLRSPEARQTSDNLTEFRETGLGAASIQRIHMKFARTLDGPYNVLLTKHKHLLKT